MVTWIVLPLLVVGMMAMIFRLVWRWLVLLFLLLGLALVAFNATTIASLLRGGWGG